MGWKLKSISYGVYVNVSFASLITHTSTNCDHISLTSLTRNIPELQKPSHSISGADLASYQFPVDEEEEEESPDDGDQHTRHVPSLDRQPSTSAMKKSPSDHSVSTGTACFVTSRLYTCSLVPRPTATMS